MSRSDMRFTRRGFVAGAGATALAAGLAGCASGTTGDEATDLASTAPEPAAYDAAEGTWVPTTCNMCFNNCSIKAHVVDGTVVELTGNPDSPIGSGHICAKGAAGIMQLYDPARITKPLKRTNPKKGFDEDPGWEEISWDEAYDTIVQKFGEAAAKDPKLNMGASMVAGLIGSVWRSLTLGCAFGVSEGTSSDICGAGVHICEFLLTGDGNAMPDYDNVDYLIQFGTQAGTATRHGFNMTADKFARRRAEDGLRLVNFDPHMSAGAEKADLWVPIRPGSDAAAALAMAYVFIHELDLIDRDYLVERTNAPALVDPATQRVLRAEGSNKSLYWDEAANAAKPYDECEKPALEGEYEVDGVKCHTAFSVLKEHIREMTPEWAEDITTVPAATLRQVAEEFGRAARIGETIEIEGKTYRRRGAAVDIFSGLSRHKHSILNVWACLQLNTLIGATNSVGGFIGFATKCHGWADNNPTAGFDLGIWEEDGFIECNSLMIGAPNSFYKIIRERDYTPTTQGLLELQPLSEDGHFVHMAMADPDLYHTTRPRNLFWYACNPIKWWANVEEQVKVYQDMDFIVGVDIYLNDMSYFSDIMLPEACYLERYDVLPQFYMNHRMIGSLDTPWTLAMWQPVVEPKDGAPGFMEIYAEIADRAGANEFFIPAVCGLYRVKEEYMFPTDQKLDVEQFIDAVYKSNIDEEHGLQWFKDNGGVYTYPRKVDEMYIWDAEAPGRIPFYWDFMLEAKEKVEAKVAELDIPWETDDYIPLPEWRPGVEFYADDPAYDIFPVYYTNASNTDTWTVQNAWLNEVNEEDGITYLIEMNTATAAEKGLASGDTVRLTSTPGYTVEGRLVVTEGIHPECVSSVVGTWDAKSKYLTIAQGKGVNLVTLIPGQDPKRMDHIVSAFDQLIRVKVEKVS
ncbi:molybdopterin-dependent oxidoreductase [Adlercreutzia equolifaciens]|jgi:anaerobic selenocysteine-containing dehydrogenase|uniref:Molybdopterin-dependent oxidoreductase n=2 Tax=Adlercreutzia equolifaciens TaxID=446660 RepID=A0A6L8Q120_9ACTN|nr:molybdopterin-dependent oxidoreductase [Adlercreutzia equolifaciens]MEE0478390.1 molybdopterin-dependent oxidoreductase [Adlercreutzia sp.]MZG27008.1 molybdopterin-dependent oxidoreductase [Adlercreutzia equolifaciens]